MSTKPPPSDLPIHNFPSSSDLETFLENHHTTIPGFYLKLAKKASGIASVSAADAVEVALCFGWIDGRANTFDQDWWLVRYTPRRTKSLWSKKNVSTVQRLIVQGRLRPAGLASIELAKADGRWDRAYDGPASITVPEDLAAVLETNQPARTFFDALNRTDRYAVLHKLQTAAPGRRTERIKETVKTLANGELSSTPTRPPGNIQMNAKGKERKNRKSTVSKVVKTDTGSARQLRPRKPRE
ncbi:hypothetical protein FE257_005774 [Aspergillus nanangensis]|uniref:Uncharacterized protein n=1 Tax=Aspergillus nanangensis TaxID=2582783 RepID=A0AAD4CRU8_ASPNN|nr:hypothetical protein FE257_005774 [Aspergillus nanangensis]